MKNIPLYKYLDEKAIESFINVSYKYLYKHNDEEIELEISEKNGDTICLQSNDGMWDSIDKGLIVETTVTLKDINKLFENNIAFADSVLSLVLLVYSNESKMKKTFEILELKSTTNDGEICKTFSIPPQKITGVLTIQGIVLLKKASLICNDKSINNTTGAILSKLNYVNVMLSGNGSLFPIFNVSKPNEPLWTFYMELNEPESDMFLDKVRVELNTSHKDFKFIDITQNDTYCDRLVLEILHHCIFQFLCTLKNEGLLNQIDDDFLDGSIMQAAKYLVKTHDIKVDSIDSIADSLNHFFDKNGGRI